MKSSPKQVLSRVAMDYYGREVRSQTLDTLPHVLALDLTGMVGRWRCAHKHFGVTLQKVSHHQRQRVRAQAAHVSLF